MKFQDHIEAYKEHKDTINWAIDRGLEKSQRIIGLHISRGIVELLSAFLHKLNFIEGGFQINHRWFKSQRTSERFPNFTKKDIILKKINQIELQSENLIYGSQKTKEQIKSLLILFNETEKILLNLINENEK